MRSTASWPGSRRRSCSPPSRSWPAISWTARGLGIRAAFVAGDEVYGGRQLRRSICQREMGYVLAVRANHVVSIDSGRAVTAAAAARLIPARAWHRMRTGSGTKGTRHYDWAMLQVAGDDTPEEDHQLAKQAAGLDAGQVIRWKPRHRWTAICLLACLCLAVAVALQRQHDAASAPGTGLIPVTIPELVRLLRDTVIPPPHRDRPHRLHWSAWRRRHQHRARQSHQRWNAYAEMTP